MTGTGLAANTPDKTFDTAVVTGYTYTLSWSQSGILTDIIEPVALQKYSRFDKLSLSCLTFASVEGQHSSFFGNEDTFDAGLSECDIYQGQKVA